MSAPGTTPGPWLLDPFAARVILPHVDAPICALLWPTKLRTETETERNGYLIAASQALYDALRELLENAPRPMDVRDMSASAVRYRKGEKALAQAEGKTK